ncbi:MAG TPA: hypothetical protein PKI93_02635 [Alphaproteobacteria bacterium]|nr:hypothetical protein [Alphaproteobacteria bacterium]HNS44571.1 hypothetical protein [Alphaproteobacteria bacterium]
MKKSLFALVSVGLFSSSAAFAKDPTDGVSPALAVGRIMCEKIFVAHQPAPDVAYQPGVDVNGNPVASADVAPSPVSVPDFMEVPMTYELAKAMKLSLPEGVEMDAVIGTLKLYKNGHVEYNGQDISSTASEFCGTTLPVDAPIPRENFEPEANKNPTAGAVAASSTVEEPKPAPAFDTPRGTVNMSR